MARTLDPSAATKKAWLSRGRAMPGTGSSPTQIRGDVYSTQKWAGKRTFAGSVGQQALPSDREVRTYTKKHLGRELSRDDVADMVGAPPGSTVYVDTQGSDGVLQVTTEFPDDGGSCWRSIDLTNKIIHNQEMDVVNSGRGIGTAVFELEVETAVKLGMEHITVEAMGEPGGGPGGQNGYYTWARMGFKAEDGNGRPQKVKGPSGPVSLHVLMAQPGGAAWWKKNGKSFIGDFDLSSGSTSRRVFDEYRRLKKEKAGG